MFPLRLLKIPEESTPRSLDLQLSNARPTHTTDNPLSSLRLLNWLLADLAVLNPTLYFANRMRGESVETKNDLQNKCRPLTTANLARLNAENPPLSSPFRKTIAAKSNKSGFANIADYSNSSCCSGSLSRKSIAMPRLANMDDHRTATVTTVLDPFHGFIS